jgi:hypothetical protein
MFKVNHTLTLCYQLPAFRRTGALSSFLLMADTGLLKADA